jgi:hypothetical protein
MGEILWSMGFMALGVASALLYARSTQDHKQMCAGCAQVRAQLASLESRVTQSIPDQLRAHVDDLHSAWIIDRAALRRELGKLWKLQDRGRNVSDGIVKGTADAADFDAMLQLQNARDVSPGGTE